MEEGKMILENIESLWFFSNILRPTSPVTCIDEKISEEGPQLLSDSESPKEAVCQQKVRSLGTFDQLGEPEEEAEEKKTNAEERTMEPTEVHTEVKESKVHMDLDACFGGSRPVPAIWEQQRMRRSYKVQNFVAPLNCYAMPPMRNSLAMKAHLKTWAYAVACTVR